MAMLLAMFQKMKLVREKNQLMLEQTQYSSKLSRLQKNIENKQKYYASLLTRVENQAKNMLNQYTYNLQSELSIFSGGMMGMNNMFGGFGGMYGTNPTAIAEILQAGGRTIQPDKLQALCYGQISAIGDGTYKYGNNGTITAKEYEDFQAASRIFQHSVQSQQMHVQGLIQNATNYNSIFIEQEKAAIEAEQEEVLGELSHQETILELEKEQRDMRLQRIQNELDNYNNLVQQEAKNSAPTFGLG